MQKIMFNDEYYLTQSTLDGYKTNTRRIEPCCKFIPDAISTGHNRPEFVGKFLKMWDDKNKSFIEFKTHYQVGEVVAISQSYQTIDDENDSKMGCVGYSLVNNLGESAGWNNKMFVRADLMPHQIKFTSVKVERIQDISDEDCLKEGIYKDTWCRDGDYEEWFTYEGAKMCDTPREAYASLIDKISGKYTWKSNPYVIAYEFELIK